MKPTSPTLPTSIPSTAWATDIHLDFLDQSTSFGKPAWSEFVRQVSEFDRLIITGDISIAALVTSHLAALRDATATEILFVLGNHDFYGGWIDATRKEVANVPGCTYLSSSDPLQLAPGVELVGVDGWYDGRNGNGFSSRVVLRDWEAIYDFQYGGQSRDGIISKLAVSSVCALDEKLGKLADDTRAVVIATHFPPWPENATYMGEISGPEYQPWYSSKILAEGIEAFSESRPDLDILVLCGHSHGWADNQITDKIRCVTGAARYCSPEVQRLDLDTWIRERTPHADIDTAVDKKA